MTLENVQKYENNLFSNHFLKERIQDTDKWQNADVEEKFDELKELYDSKKGFLSEKLNEDQTQSEFIDPVLKALDHKWVPEARTRVGSKKKGTILNPDYTFMDMETQMDVHDNEEKSYFDVNYAVGDAKAWNRTLDKSTQDHTNPAFQIYNYVDRLRANWGILTNGKKWRLYSYEKCAADIYFEIDLENLLKGEKTEQKLEKFKYFYLFFQQESFEKDFLKKVYEESVNFAEGLEDDLEDKVYDALEVAVEGFFKTNNIEKTEENIDLVHHASLIFLYRILFILNAESRNLLPTKDEAYRQAFGLTQLKRMIVNNEEDDPLFQQTTVAWDNRVTRLFEGIDEGYDLHETEIPAYNGGLFDEQNGQENQFLAQNKLYGSYLKDILKLLATSYDQEKEKRIILDYKDLNIRHLGSVYEGLLEHKFKAAEERKILKNGEWQNLSETSKDWEEIDEDKKVEENELYLTNESGERKATGSYYTPEYIVEYIVENTVGPKVEEKIEEAEENNEKILPKVLELNVCDPAMGSGHFLTEATDFIAENIVEHANLEEQDIGENEDELNWAKRQVVQNCIYGVDINELAVELGKLSLWIETMAEGKPLNFLDHHLKHGNSLIGSNIDDIQTHPNVDSRDSENLSDFGDFIEDGKKILRNQYRKIEQMPENSVKQIHKKEQKYKEFIKENIVYQNVKKISNVHTYQHFDGELSPEEYHRFTGFVHEDLSQFKDEEWYQNADKDAQNWNYFHWQLEFPKVFFGQTQGFDAVIGNPPYVKIQNIGNEMKDYFDQEYSVTEQRFDLYGIFVEQGSYIASEANLSYILPNKFFKSRAGSPLRELIQNIGIGDIVDFSDYQVFEGVTTYTSILRLQSGKKKFEYAKVQDKENFKEEKSYLYELDRKIVNLNSLEQDSWKFVGLEEEKILEKFSGEKLIDLIQRISVGIQTSSDSVYFLDKVEENSSTIKVKSKHTGEKHELEREMVKPVLKGKHLNSPYKPPSTDKVVLYPYRNEDGESQLIEEDEMEEKYPKTLNYLKECRPKLEERDEKGRDFDAWYFHWRPRNPKWFEKDKILTPYMASSPSFTYDNNSEYYHNTKVYSFFSDSDAWTDTELLGVLNSKALFFHIKLGSSMYRGGYYTFTSDYLKNFNMPESGSSTLKESAEKCLERNKKLQEEKDDFLEWVEAEWGVDIDDLSLKTHLREYWEHDFDSTGTTPSFMRVAKKNKSSIDGDVKSRDFRERMKEEWESSMDTLRPLIQEIDELENEIDAIVFNLYELTEEEVETVLDSLDTREREKRRILERFEKL